MTADDANGDNKGLPGVVYTSSNTRSDTNPFVLRRVLSVLAAVFLFAYLIIGYYESLVKSRSFFQHAAAISSSVTFKEQLKTLQNASFTRKAANTTSASSLIEEYGKKDTTPTSAAPDLFEAWCLQELGKNGSWVQDWAFAKEYGQHRKPHNIPSGDFMKNRMNKFVPSVDAPFHWETSWRWIDNININSTNNVGPTALTNTTTGATKSAPALSCQIDHTINSSVEKVCSLLQKFGTRRMLFMGDSLTEYQFASFINMIGPSPSLIIGRNKYRHTLLCLSSSAENGGINVTTKIELELKILHCGQAYQWSEHKPLNLMDEGVLANLQRNPTEPMMVVLNIGAHYHNASLYKTDVDYAMKTFKALKQGRKNNLFFFRTTMPGHYHCNPRRPGDEMLLRDGQRHFPYRNFEDYSQFASTIRRDPHTWSLFEGYNAYVTRT